MILAALAKVGQRIINGMDIVKSFSLICFGLLVSSLCIAQNTPQANDPTLSISRRWQVYPVIASTPETSWMFGLAAIKVFGKKDSTQNNFDRVSTYTPFFVYTLKNQFILDNLVDYYSLSGWNITSRLKFAYFPNRFFGIGSNSDGNSELYTNREYRFRVAARRQIHPKWFPGLTGDFNYDVVGNFEKGQVLDTADIHGEAGGLLWGIGPGITFDSRNNSVFPTKGSLIRLEEVIYPRGLGNSYHLNRYSFDARKYVGLGNKKKNVLAMQAFFAFNSGNDIPFYKMEELGGDDRIRGFHSQRYLDKAVAYAQAEYRFIIWRFIGMATFAGIGDVYDDTWNFSNPKYSGGLGIRLQLSPSQRLNLRFDYAIGTDKQDGFYFGLREAF